MSKISKRNTKVLLFEIVICNERIKNKIEQNLK